MFYSGHSTGLQHCTHYVVIIASHVHKLSSALSIKYIAQSKLMCVNISLQSFRVQLMISCLTLFVTVSRSCNSYVCCHHKSMLTSDSNDGSESKYNQKTGAANNTLIGVDPIAASNTYIWVYLCM
jgi:hypothetical protein